MRLVISGSFTGVVVREVRQMPSVFPADPGCAFRSGQGFIARGTGGAGSRYRSEVTP
jgi:hypothetical protein